MLKIILFQITKFSQVNVLIYVSANQSDSSVQIIIIIFLFYFITADFGRPQNPSKWL